jgi:hypothetical protein
MCEMNGSEVMRSPSYSFLDRSFYRLGRDEDAFLLDLGFSPARKFRGKHGAKVYSSGPLGLPIQKTAHALDAIHLRRPFGRFGNQLLQVINAIVLARRWDVSEVLAPGNFVIEHLRDIDRQSGVTLRSDPRNVTWGPKRYRRLVPHWKSQTHLAYNTFFAQEPGELEQPIGGEELDPVLEMVRSSWSSPSPEPLETSHLVIHLRSGDVFNEDPNPLYGQPPLAYYSVILDDRAWQKVTLVREDDTHPLEPRINQMVRQQGIPIDYCSGTLESDRQFLRSATSLVASRGTFIPAVASLSKHLQCLYVFGSVTGIHSSVQIVQVEDRSGEFMERVCAENWANSSEQLDLMHSYPESHLSIRPVN